MFRSGGRSYLGPFVIVSSLFLLWGFAHGMLEVLNPHFQESFHMSKMMSAFVQAAVYGAYFLMAIPAGRIIHRWGYRTGVVTGLSLFAIGALLFIPGSAIGSFAFFVFSLFVIGCGLTCLETSANPYVTVLGDPARAESRINLAQSLNGMGWIFGPLIGGRLLFSGVDISVPYTAIGVVVLCIAMIFLRIRLPEIMDCDDEAAEGPEGGALWTMPFVMSVLALFLYVAAQTGINSFFINYMTENADIDKTTAANWLAFGGMGLFVVGRLLASWIMSRVDARVLLCLYAFVAAVSSAFIVMCRGEVTLVAFFAVYFCESIMFPTIFSLGIRSSNGHTKQASSVLIMTIVGGAVAPLLMGYIADATKSMPLAFTVPLACFLYISVYARMSRRQGLSA